MLRRTKVWTLWAAEWPGPVNELLFSFSLGRETILSSIVEKNYGQTFSIKLFFRPLVQISVAPSTEYTRVHFAVDAPISSLDYA